MTLVLPHEFAASDVISWGLAGSTISGPQNAFGESIDRRTDGGGEWIASLPEIPLLNADSARMWFAYMIRASKGNGKIIVPMCPGRVRAGFVGPLALVPHSDGTLFSDDTAYLSGSEGAVLNGAVANRATQATVTLPAGGELLGAEPFTLVSDVFGPHLYAIDEVLDVDGQNVTFTFGPPARGDHADEAEADFQNPRCIMRPVLAQLDGGWPSWDVAWQAQVAMVWRETWR